MLIKPPALHDEVLSNRSNSHSPAAKQRPHKKQSTIAIGGAKHSVESNANDQDNHSVHSNGSKGSKSKKKKEGSLGGVIVLPPKYQEDDGRSAHSGTSKNSIRGAKKESSLGRPKVSGMNNSLEEPVESIIQRKRENSPQIVDYDAKRQATANQTNRNHRFSPFEQIQQHADDGPIFRLEEHSAEKKKQVIILSAPGNSNKKNTQRQRQKEREKEKEKERQREKKERERERQKEKEKEKEKIRERESPVNLIEKPIITEESRVTQSRNQKRRRQIFGTKQKQLQNASNVSSIGLSSVVQDSRRKSKSKLGELLRESREKEKSQNLDQQRQSFGALPEQSRLTIPEQSKMLGSSIKPAVANSPKPIQRKVLADDNDNFAQEESKSDLNLSMSRNNGQPNAANQIQKESLIFQFEPEKKKFKGLSLASKQVKQVKKQMVQIEGNLTSKDISTEKLLLIESNLVSREIMPKTRPKITQKSQQEKKIMQKLKENDDYISNSGLMNLPQEPAMAFGMNQLLKQAYHQEAEDAFMKNAPVIDDQPWHQIVSQKQILKQVERKQVVPGKERDSNTKEIERKEAERRANQEQERKRIQLERERQDQQKKKKEIKEKEEKIDKEKEKERMKQLKRIEQSKKLQEQKLQEQLKRRAEMEEMKKIQKLKKQQKIKIEQQQSSSNPRLFQGVPTTMTAPLSERSSDGSTGSRKKSKGKKQTTLKMNKPHKVEIRPQSPKQEESFYEESQHQEKPEKPKEPKEPKEPKQSARQPKILSFDDNQIQQEKPKSRTDMNFYPSGSQLSVKHPSSKPPLSKKSNVSSSKSKSKPKESTLPIMIKGQKQAPPPMKKLTILQKAMMARQESGSQGSGVDESISRSRESRSKDSRESIGSSGSGSRKSTKKQGTINIQTNRILHKPPVPQKRQSQISFSDPQPPITSNRTQPDLREHPRTHQVEPRTIISKDTFFIDGRGRLVKQDLVIKGDEVYGRKGQEDVERQVYQRMKKSRERQRSRSRSNRGSRERSRDGSRNGSKVYENGSRYENGYENASRYENGSRYNTYNNFNRGGYQTSQNQSAEESASHYTSSSYYAPAPPQFSNRPVQSPLRDFIKPVEQVPVYDRQPTRLNQMFGGEPGTRRTMGRTQGSARKR